MSPGSCSLRRNLTPRSKLTRTLSKSQNNLFLMRGFNQNLVLLSTILSGLMILIETIHLADSAFNFVD